MKLSKKAISIFLVFIFIITMCTNVFATDTTPVATENVIINPGFNCNFIYIPTETTVGTTISADVAFFNVPADLEGNCIYFTVNGERSIDYTTINYTISNGKVATFYWEATEAYEGSNVQIGFCVEKDGKLLFNENRNVYVKPAPVPSLYDVSSDFIYITPTLTVGDVLTAEVAIINNSEDFNATAYFTVNGERSIDYTMINFQVTTGKTATFYWNATEEFKDKYVAIGFCIEKDGKLISQSERTINVTSVPPEAPLNFKCNFSYLPENANPAETMTAEVICENFADDFSATAYFTVNGERSVDYTFTGFVVSAGKTATFYWNAPDAFVGRAVAIGFVLERYGTVIYKLEKNVSIIAYDEQAAIRNVMNKVRPVNVEATVKYTTNKYSDVGLTRKIGTVEKGTKVYCISSKSDYSNEVRLPDGSICWVSLSSLNISTKNYTNPIDLTKEEKEIYVNNKGYTSDTDYLIFINLERQMTNVFLRENGRWKLIRECKCATGTNANPTITGIFKYYAIQKSWNYNTYYVGPCLIFSGNYAMHSVLLNYNGTIFDGTVGRPASHGCVRLLPDDINWIAGYVPLQTTVVIV